MISLTVTRQLPAGPVIELDAPLSEIHGRFVDTSSVRTATWRSVRAGVADQYISEIPEYVEQSDIPEHVESRFALAGLFVRIGRGDVKAVLQLLDGVLPVLAEVSIDAAIATLPTLFEWGDVSPTVAFRVTDETRELRRDQREDLFAFIAALSNVCDVRLVTTGPDRLWLAKHHREDLPGVSEHCNTHPTDGPVSELVETAQTELKADGRPVMILRTLAEEPSETLAYAELQADAQVSRSRIRQCLSQLANLGLVATFHGAGGKCVELLEAGREFVVTLDREIGRQRQLEECVSEAGKSRLQCRVSPNRHDSPPDYQTDRSTAATPYRTRYLDRPTQVAAVACAEPGVVSMVTDPVETDTETRRTRLVGYDENRDEGVVAIHTSTPLQYIVSLATALASPRFIDSSLPVSRLETVLDTPPRILRDARCIGALSDEAIRDPQRFRDALVEWGEEIAHLTTKQKHGNYNDRNRLRADIMRSAHGLAGTIVHVLDVAGIDLIREIRVPSGLNGDHHAALAKSIAISTAIQSRKGHFTAYRQLFEDREDKRAATFAPEIDAVDPFGELIGSFVVRGGDVHRFRSHLERHLGAPRPVHDDAPEFAVPVSIRSIDSRTPYRTVATRLLQQKNLRPTREAVSLIRALVGSPYDASRALFQLGTEDRLRQLRSHDVRYALATLSADRILPNHAPTLGAAVSTLLSATTPLSSSELADRADVSTRSVRNHRETLTALGFATETDGKWRLDLSFNTAEERRSNRYPTPIVDNLTTLKDLIMAVATTVTDPRRIGNPGDPLYRELLWDGDPWNLRDDEDVGPWIATLAALVDCDRPPDDLETRVEMGPSIDQQPLTASIEVACD